jgi:DNA-binding NarL/FixJ family response regulator
LTTREREILTLIAEGRNNAAITIQLGLSMKTVQNHISNIFGKLQVANRAQAIVRARDAGFGTADTASRHKSGFPWSEA